jgi:hypothetical protein
MQLALRREGPSHKRQVNITCQYLQKKTKKISHVYGDIAMHKVGGNTSTICFSPRIKMKNFFVRENDRAVVGSSSLIIKMNGADSSLIRTWENGWPN